jgi:hypothetical protein
VRFTAQLLAGPPAASPVDVVERLLAVQAQDPRGFRLAIRARTTGLTAADVDRALADRSLVVSWLNRGTLHLVRAEDYWWLHALTTPPLVTGNARRLAQEGVPPGDAERGVRAVARALADGPLAREALRERVAAAGVRTAGQALVHVLFLASLRGLVVRGPMVGKQHAWVLARDWLGPPPEVDRDAALTELARRYLRGHGAATDRDLAKWAGLPLRDARRALAGVAPPDVPDLPDPSPGEAPPPRLLGAYDELLMGWASRHDVLGAHEAKVVSGGLFRPFALVRGGAVATWSYDGDVTLAPFARLSRDDRAALDADAADVRRFLAQDDVAAVRRERH